MPAKGAVIARSEVSDDKRTLAGIVRKRRMQAELSQTILASRLGRPQAVVAEIENARRKVDVFEFIQLARALGVEPSELFHELIELSTR